MHVTKKKKNSITDRPSYKRFNIIIDVEEANRCYRSEAANLAFASDEEIAVDRLLSDPNINDIDGLRLCHSVTEQSNEEDTHTARGNHN